MNNGGIFKGHQFMTKARFQRLRALGGGTSVKVVVIR